MTNDPRTSPVVADQTDLASAAEVRRAPGPLGAASGELLVSVDGPFQLAGARRRVCAWANNLAGVGLDGADDIALIAYELMAIAVQRASAHQRGRVCLAAVRRGGGSEGDEVVLRLWDDGCLRPAHPDPGWRGPGMRLVRALGARLEVQSTDRGTVLNVRWELP